MTWRELFHNGQARLDYTLAGMAISAPAWVPSLADMTNFFVFLTALGGFVLICFRIRRQWKHRNDPPGR